MPSSDSSYYIKMVNALFLALPGGVIEKVEHYSLAWFILIFPKKNYNTESIHITRHTAHTYFLKEEAGEHWLKVYIKLPFYIHGCERRVCFQQSFTFFIKIVGALNIILTLSQFSTDKPIPQQHLLLIIR